MTIDQIKEDLAYCRIKNIELKDERLGRILDLAQQME